MAEVKVLGLWYSPYVKRVEMALKFKGVEYEYMEEDLQNKSPLLLQSNPIHKKVPVLIHNGKPIVESAVILEYIDQVWDQAPSIMPQDPYQRAIARFWVKFIDEKCISTAWRAFWSTGEEQEKLKKEATDAFEILENEIGSKKYFGGESIGIVDIAATFIAYWIPLVSELVGIQLLPETKFPNLCRWGNHCCNNPLVKESLPDKDAIIAKFNSNSNSNSNSK